MLRLGLEQEDHLVRATRTKAVRSQGGPGLSAILGALGAAGLPAPVLGLLGSGAGSPSATNGPVQQKGSGHRAEGGSGTATIVVDGQRLPVAVAERRVVQAAERYLGVPYACGGNSHAGIDCFGLDIGRDTSAQLASGRAVGRDGHWEVDRRLLQPGDLIFYGQPGASGPNAHVVMYVGDGKVVQAPYTGQRVQISPLFSSASPDEPFLGVRRYLHPAATPVAAHPGAAGSGRSGQVTV